MNGRLSDNADETILRQYLAQIVADRFGSRPVIVSLQRARIRYIGSYDCDTVTVLLTNGEEFKLFLKDFGFSQRSKDEPEQRRERELRVYRDLLAGTDLGTPTYYGSIWDESQGRFWLLLELVEGTVIKDHNVEYGVMAAGWLGQMQGFFTRQPEYLTGCDFLIRHDEGFFRSKAELALRDVAQIAPASAPRLAKIVACYDQAIKVMAAQPRTLVHGGYIPWHILLDMTNEPVRVCPIDWELAAAGATLYDLAFFTDGVEPPARDRIWEAYRRAARQYNVPLPDRTQMGYIVDCFRLHRIFDWLSRAVEKQFSAHKVGKLVELAEQQSALVFVNQR
jgi:hypothetical protein